MFTHIYISHKVHQNRRILFKMIETMQQEGQSQMCAIRTNCHLSISDTEWKWDETFYEIMCNVRTCLYLWESGNEQCFRLLNGKNEQTQTSLQNLFCPHSALTLTEGSEGGPILFHLSLVCGDPKSALHNIDVCGCVFMHGTKWNL